MRHFQLASQPQTIDELHSEFVDGWTVLRKKRDRALYRKGVSVTQADRDTIRRLDGLDPAAGFVSAADGPARTHLAGKMLTACRRGYEKYNGVQHLHVTLIFGSLATSDEHTTIDLRRLASESRKIFDEMHSDWAAAIEIGVFSNVKHRDGGRLVSPHVHCLMRGRDILDRAQAVAKRKNGELAPPVEGCLPVLVQKIRPALIDLARVVRYPFKAPNRCKNRYVSRKTGRTTVNESEKPDRFIRYLRMFQVHSLIEQRQLMFASGKLAKVQSRALSNMERHRGERATSDELTREEIEAFWRDFMPRMGLQRFRMPKIIA